MRPAPRIELHQFDTAPEAGFSLLEVVVAMSILVVGLLGLAQTFYVGMSLVSTSSPNLIAREKAREAIARLVQDGLAIPARRSTRTQVAVAPLTAADLHELYTIMGALEGAAARTLGSMTPGDRKSLAAARATHQR